MKCVYIIIRKDELLMQMRQTMGLFARTSAIPAEQRNVLTDFTDGGLKELMDSYIDMSWSEVLQAAEAYNHTASPCDAQGANTYKDKDAYRMELTMPTTYNDGATVGLVQNIQEYMLSASLGRYLLLVSPNDATTFSGRAEAALLQVRRLLDSRVSPSRVQPFPAW